MENWVTKLEQASPLFANHSDISQQAPLVRTELISIAASSIRLKLHLLKEVEKDRIGTLLSRLEKLVIENIEDMNVMDLV